MNFVYYYANNNNYKNIEYCYESSDDTMDVEEFAVMYGNLTLLADVDYYRN
jgi:hypothetical protein